MTGILAHGAEAESAWPAAGTVLAVAVLGVAYAVGVSALWQRRGRGRVLGRWRVASFAAGLGVTLLALAGPVDSRAEESFAWHMNQHMLLLTVAGPLLAAGGAGLPFLLALPRSGRRAVARLRAAAPVRSLRRPLRLALVAGTLQTLVLWVWHLPGPYLAALDSGTVHAAEHASFLGAGWLLWSSVLGPGRRRLSGPVGVLLVLVTGMPAAALGAVLTLALRPLYPAEAFHGAADPLRDQQIAGLVMWVPMNAVALALAVAVFLGWLARLDRLVPAGRELLPADVARQEEVIR